MRFGKSCLKTRSAPARSAPCADGAPAGAPACASGGSTDRDPGRVPPSGGDGCPLPEARACASAAPNSHNKAIAPASVSLRVMFIMAPIIPLTRLYRDAFKPSHFVAPDHTPLPVLLLVTCLSLYSRTESAVIICGRNIFNVPGVSNANEAAHFNHQGEREWPFIRPGDIA
jgi:hypothetical protein